MRTEARMMSLIMDTAANDERIRAVILNGSRANPNVKKDIFQDYDIVYAVRETRPFIDDKHWIDIFGEPLVIQQPDLLDSYNGKKTNFDTDYAYLMQFADGNRIDLTIRRTEAAIAEAQNDRLTVVLMDKDNAIPQLPLPDDSEYHVKKPTDKQFFAIYNEFWWISPYITKGLWRGEILFALDHFNFHWRTELIKMLSILVGTETDFSVSVGKCGKHLNRYLSADHWERLMKTYFSGDYSSVWDAYFIAAELFDEAASIVAERLGYDYDKVLAKRCIEYARHIRSLPADAAEII